MPELLSYKEACNRVAMGMAKSFRFCNDEDKEAYPKIIQHHNGNFINTILSHLDTPEAWSCSITGCECMQRKAWMLTEVSNETAD